jgi:hypothetical protein
MAKKAAVCPIHNDNKKRSEAKLKRNKGLLAIQKSGLSIIEWCQKLDPFFGIKGKERHRRLHQI